jgi:hypothetical protein
VFQENPTQAKLHQAILDLIVNQASFNYNAPFGVPLLVSSKNTPFYGGIVLTFCQGTGEGKFSVAINVTQLNLHAGAV